MNFRVRDWQSRLAVCLAERWARPFEWGVQDCCMFAADCILACSGIDPAEDLRGTYADALGAQRVLREHGGVEALAAARCGADCPVALAQVGDVGLVLLPGSEGEGDSSEGEGDSEPGQGRPALAICGGGHWYGAGALGVERLVPGSVQRAWRVC